MTTISNKTRIKAIKPPSGEAKQLVELWNTKYPKGELNTIEQAEIVSKLYNFYNQKEMSFLLHRDGPDTTISVPQISNLMLINTLPVKMKKRIANGELSATLALETLRQMKGKDHAEVQKYLESKFSEAGTDKITRTDIRRMEGRYNSVNIFKKVMEQFALTAVPKQKRTAYEFGSALVSGNLDKEAILNFLGLSIS